MHVRMTDMHVGLLQAVEVYEDVARGCVDNNLLKYSAKGYLLNAGICRLCSTWWRLHHCTVMRTYRMMDACTYTCTCYHLMTCTCYHLDPTERAMYVLQAVDANAHPQAMMCGRCGPHWTGTTSWTPTSRALARRSSCG